MEKNLKDPDVIDLNVPRRAQHLRGLNEKEVIFPKEEGEFYFSNRRWTNLNPWRRSGLENIHFDTAASNSRRKSP